MSRVRGGGRKPTPTRLKLLRNNPGKRPLNPDEPQPEATLPEPPAHLSDEAKCEWQRRRVAPVGAPRRECWNQSVPLFVGA